MNSPKINTSPVKYWRHIIALLSGPLLLAITLLTPPPSGMPKEAWVMSGLALWMAVWWMTEVIPIPVTALLPIVVAPLLGLASVAQITAPYSHPTIYLFMGGFMLGMAMQRWNLHRRIALSIMRSTGTEPRWQIAGFMLATAFLSMWVSNTATAVMMLPIGLSVASMMQKTDPDSDYDAFTRALLLAIAYSASIGGLATIIGTPPNALFVAFMQETYAINISFAQWMAVGLPISLILLVAAWFWLTRFQLQPGIKGSASTQTLIEEELAKLGVMSRGEKTVALIFIATAAGWMLRPLLNSVIPGLTDPGIAIAASISLFIIPVNAATKTYVLSWKKAAELPWGVLLLFGGGLSLAATIKSTGLAQWIAASLSIVEGLPVILIVGFIVVVIVFLTELTSNTATAAGFLPLLGALAITLGVDPVIIAAPAAIAASCAFMMPVATPPNAVVFGSGKLSIADMVKAGFVLNLFASLIVTICGYWIVRAVLT
ncbi:Sodium-dependent dicarboxylate transporter SdcS [BD1-7 clade bacterium]|uniref:Sodium-dependent dicarboxylate transporter SdcS n=1 Tax=BD1-7 clade bacterium TaxID=2029982 RepID=A0A5S9PNP3_9GAMM|nr:Sodium-dependent dicarboxylate transporter SdcS [BD1-7 clade bacterium]